MIENDACRAIGERKIVTFYYDGTLRTVEPHLVGYDHDGDLTLSAWQLSGGSGRGFRAFHLRNATAFSITQQNFERPRPGYNRNDRSIGRFLCRL